MGCWFSPESEASDIRGGLVLACPKQIHQLWHCLFSILVPSDCSHQVSTVDRSGNHG